MKIMRAYEKHSVMLVVSSLLLGTLSSPISGYAAATGTKLGETWRARKEAERRVAEDPSWKNRMDYCQKSVSYLEELVRQREKELILRPLR